jgi:endonuclease/exonuclease/phosphatase family metal-dependent hydrolase
VTVASMDAGGASGLLPSLKVLTMNTHWGFTPVRRRFVLPELREAVRSVSADVVFLQEVLGGHTKHGRRYLNWPEQPQYEFLADTIWSDFAYGRNAVYPEGNHGNALLSKFPIVRYQNLDISVDGRENRGLLHCVLQLPAQIELHTVCVHLGLREAERQRQLALLCELVRGLPAGAPVVVAGDFNDWRLRASAVLARSAGLEEAFERAHGAVARSYPSLWPALRLDRIYARNAITLRPVVLSRRPWSRLSDHLPLAAEVRL